ncbi:MAG TPA: cell division protein ZapA [Phycisphaerae bacterium]|nr:cell division protein ZapA [Phycisphaerae bacterium]
MSKAAKTVTVNIMDKEYRVSCKPGEEDALLASALNLDERMRSIRKTGKIIGTERIAVMAALNMAHELLNFSNDSGAVEAELEQKMRSLQDRVEVALHQFNQLEL